MPDTVTPSPKVFRYFFFVYSYWGPSAEGKGNFCLKATNFPSRKKINDTAVDLASRKYDSPSFKFSIVIENWIEMSESDWANWNN